MPIDVQHKWKLFLYVLREKVFSRPRNRSPFSRVIGRKVLTYRPSAGPCLEPQPLLNATLKLIPRDGYVTEMTIRFFEDGTVSRTTAFSHAESRDPWTLPKTKHERFDSEESMILYQRLLSLNTPTWKKYYRHYDQIMDGMEWILTIENQKGGRCEYGGDMIFPPEWNETRTLFGLEPLPSNYEYILSD